MLHRPQGILLLFFVEHMISMNQTLHHEFIITTPPKGLVLPHQTPRKIHMAYIPLLFNRFPRPVFQTFFFSLSSNCHFCSLNRTKMKLQATSGWMKVIKKYPSWKRLGFLFLIRESFRDPPNGVYTPPKKWIPNGNPSNKNSWALLRVH